MATFKRRINTSVLPDDILSYTDTLFYNVVRQFIGETTAELLEVQGIRSPDSLILIPDVFAILDIKCAALIPLKEKLCLKSDDDTYVVKPGIKSLMNYFCELIIKKQGEDMKNFNRSKGSTTVASYNNNGISSIQQQQSALSNATTIIPSPCAIPFDENFHRNFIRNSINNWCQKYYPGLCLNEGVDYHLLLSLSDDRSFIAKIICGCGSKIRLVRLRKKFQMSNFYKHLVSLTCTTIGNIRRKDIVSKKKYENEIDYENENVLYE